MRSYTHHITHRLKKSFGSPLLGRSYEADTSNGYRFGMNRQEKDNEIIDGAYSAEYWEYDSRLGRRWNLDLKPNPSISAYACYANNPILYVDNGGDTITIPNPADRELVLKMINSRARGFFGINEKGQLYIITKEGAEGYSEEYRDDLIAGIEDNNTITIKLSDTYTKPYFVIVKGKVVVVGETPPLSVDKKGGGVTLPTEKVLGDKRDINQTVTINGKDYNTEGSSNTNNVKDTNGKPLKYEAADILLHELASHGIPNILNQKVNAVVEENKVREQLSPGRNTLRAADANHPSCMGCKD